MDSFTDHVGQLRECSGRHPLRSVSSVVRSGKLRPILAWTVVFLTGDLQAFGQPLTEEGVEQIERRIRRQREENLQAVHSLIDRLTSQFDEQRAALAKEEEKLRTMGSPYAFDTSFDLPAIEAKLEM